MIQFVKVFEESYRGTTQAGIAENRGLLGVDSRANNASLVAGSCGGNHRRRRGLFQLRPMRENVQDHADNSVAASNTKGE